MSEELEKWKAEAGRWLYGINVAARNGFLAMGRSSDGSRFLMFVDHRELQCAICGMKLKSVDGALFDMTDSKRCPSAANSGHVRSSAAEVVAEPVAMILDERSYKALGLIEIGDMVLLSDELMERAANQPIQRDA